LFDVFGGSQTLDDNDFIDVTLYLDNRNFKNVYKKLNFKYIDIHNNNNDYDNILNYYNKNITSKYKYLDVYNIEFNTMLKDKVNEAKRIGYIQLIKNKIKTKNNE